MRLGKRLTRKQKQGWRKAADAFPNKAQQPLHVSRESIVGQVQADLIASLYAPLLEDTATRILETYVGQLSDYEDYVKQQQQQQQRGDANVEADGTIEITEEVSYDTTEQTPPRRPVFHSQHTVREFMETVDDVSSFFFDDAAHWRVGARAARFERLLEERYGVFLPFVKAHPELEVALRTAQLRWQQGYFSPFRRGPAPIPRSTAVVILFMMQRGGMRWEIILLSALFFLVGLQPWALVALVALAQTLFWRRQRTPIGGMTRTIPRTKPYYHHVTNDDDDDDIDDQANHAILKEPVGQALQGKETLDVTNDYDVIVVGCGVPTLYTAALLTRAGRRVLVLSDGEDASGCLTLAHCPTKLRESWGHVPFDIDNNTVAKISQQQVVLAPALSTETDPQGGIRFAQVGTQADGYCFEVLSIPGVGTERLDQEIPIPVTSDATTQLMDDAASYLGDGWPASDGGGGGGGVGSSTTGAYIQACQQINASASLYYLGKILPDTVNSLRSNSSYGDCAVRYVQSLLNRSFPLNAHTRSLMAGLGMKTECLRPQETSLAAHITHLSAATSGEGMHYPVGGPRATAHALAAVITQGGGRILTGVTLDEYLFDESHVSKTGAATAVEGQEDIPACPRCVGVKLKDGRKMEFAPHRWTDFTSQNRKSKSKITPAVVDTKGFLHAFIHRLPNDIRNKYKVPRGLPALTESRPVFKICLALWGTPEELNLTGADYYRLPNAARAQDELHAETGQVRLGEIGWPMENETTNTTMASSSSAASTDEEESIKPLVETVNEDTEATELTRPVPKKGRGYHYRTGESWLHISFPSAKDPSFVERHGEITTCVVTIEADDEFVQAYDTKPHLFVAKPTVQDRTKLGRLQEAVMKDVFEIFPQLEGNVLHSEMRGLISRGLSHNPERYAARGIRPETPYPGLYVGGPDLTVGGSFAAAIVAGWLTVNAVIGYSFMDLLFLGKNITADIQRFLEGPDLYEEEDLAVPYTPPPPPPPHSVGTDASIEDEVYTGESEE